MAFGEFLYSGGSHLFRQRHHKRIRQSGGGRHGVIFLCFTAIDKQIDVRRLFFEATINEIFCDTIDSPDSLKALSKEKIHLLSNMWNLHLPRSASYPIMDKYQIALILLLIQLWNALMHYEPAWFTSISSLNPTIEDWIIYQNDQKVNLSCQKYLKIPEILFPG